MLDVAKLTLALVGVVGKERRLVALASRHRQNDVPLGRNDGSLQRLRRVAWNLEVLVWRCCARLPNVLGSFLEVFDDCLYVGCRLSPRDRTIIREVNETAVAS